MLQLNAEGSEPGDRSLHRKSRQHIPDDVAIPEKIFRCHNVVSHVTSSPARDKNLRSNVFRAVQQEDATVVFFLCECLCCGDRAGQTSRACTHDDDSGRVIGHFITASS